LTQLSVFDFAIDPCPASSIPLLFRCLYLPFDVYINIACVMLVDSYVHISKLDFHATFKFNIHFNKRKLDDYINPTCTCSIEVNAYIVIFLKLVFYITHVL
jgi:hypothetical protein